MGRLVTGFSSGRDRLIAVIVRPARLTDRLQLPYGPARSLTGVSGFGCDTITGKEENPCANGTGEEDSLCPRQDSNLRPSAPEADALSPELRGLNGRNQD